MDIWSRRSIPARAVDVSPLFQVAFAVQEAAPYPLKHDGIEISPLKSDSTAGVARYELTFNFSETADGLLGAVEYSSDLFSKETVENILAQYVLLLEQVVDDPRQGVDEYELATAWDRSLQLEWQPGTEELSRETL